MPITDRIATICPPPTTPQIAYKLYAYSKVVYLLLFTCLLVVYLYLFTDVQRFDGQEAAPDAGGQGSGSVRAAPRIHDSYE